MFLVILYNVFVSTKTAQYQLFFYFLKTYNSFMFSLNFTNLDGCKTKSWIFICFSFFILLIFLSSLVPIAFQFLSPTYACLCTVLEYMYSYSKWIYISAPSVFLVHVSFEIWLYCDIWLVLVGSTWLKMEYQFSVRYPVKLGYGSVKPTVVLDKITINIFTCPCCMRYYFYLSMYAYALFANCRRTSIFNVF